MVETLNVSLSGCAFSFLLYENVKSQHDQEGFLLGEIITKEVSKVTDADQEVKNIEKVIKINSVLPCPQKSWFHNQAEKVNNKKLKELLGNNANKVVAWYKYKSINTIKLTLREKIVHKGLMNLFGGDLFAMCILTFDCSENFSTHTFSQTFVRYSNDFQQIPVHITNLSEKNNYYKIPEILPSSFNKIVNSLNIDLEKSHGVEVACKIHEALQKHTEDLVKKLDKSEKEVFLLEEEIKMLMQNLKQQCEPVSDIPDLIDFSDQVSSKYSFSDEIICKKTSNSSEKSNCGEISNCDGNDLNNSFDSEITLSQNDNTRYTTRSKTGALQ